MVGILSAHHKWALDPCLPVPSSAMVDEHSEQIKCTKIPVELTLPLRHSVLWPDRPISFVRLPEDDLGLHYGAFLPQNGVPVAVISLFLVAIPIDVTSRPQATVLEPSVPQQVAVRFRKFACDPPFQKIGIGTQLLKHSLSMARSELGVTIAWCDARTSTKAWYTKRGFEPIGPVFYKADVEYVRMKIQLDDFFLSYKES
ncbi:hypothetical protein CPB83DRAFT_887122 [Crepidotus variabilis]|uniref:N-acetyltransferase domain-containing protein n=1 Tax=Crepidotus variabilis TaxID=179855 RepID=A0A9P6E5Y1_9AGAR|nr:hypothetical protein CPB83DRAFT_887122 [Crepidotus variabilis]